MGLLSGATTRHQAHMVLGGQRFYQRTGKGGPPCVLIFENFFTFRGDADPHIVSGTYSHEDYFSMLIVNERLPHLFATAVIAAVWFINGFFCKVLDLVPRHQEIVARILGEQHALPLTKAIGLAEVLMVVWILSRIKRRFCAVFQIVAVLAMNIIEFVRVPDLLLFGRMNILIALGFVALIYGNEFILTKRGSLKQAV